MQTQYSRICPQCSTPFTSIWPKQRCCSRSCASRLRQTDTPERIAERFWSLVDRSGTCWLWTGNCDTATGYGRFNAGGRKLRAHRVAWALTHGPIPDGLEVCHNCPTGDNPTCVNPAHLFLGTQADNMADMVRKGRSLAGERHNSKRYPDRIARGERNGAARLSAELVREMRARYAAGGVTYKALGALYGVSAASAHLAVTGKSWAHVR
jgi:hypothetical protein